MYPRKNFLKKYFCITLLFLFKFSFAQYYPPYTITAYDTSSNGYYFLVPIQIVNLNGHGPTQMILDGKGRVVYFNEITTFGCGDFKLQPNGLMSYNRHSKFYLMDSTFTVVDSIRCKNGLQTDGHDLQILPNGHFLLLGYENITMDLSMYYVFSNNQSPGSSTASVKCGVIQEQDANKNVVWEWHAKDHFNFSDVDTSYLYSPTVVDWNHMNAIEQDHDGNFLLSSRYFDEITKINRADSSIMWRLGGLQNQFTFTNDPNKFIGQHDIRRLANGDITLFDNGRGAFPFHAASGKEYHVDDSLMTATLVWSYVENPTSFSSAIGNVQRLQNGNTLVDFGITNNENRVFDVVDSIGNKIFEITFNDTLRSYRAFNYPTLPWALHRPQISCVLIGSQYYLDAGVGYSKYLWSTGDTTQMIPVTLAGTYNCFVPYGNEGGTISSDYLDVVNVADPCNLASTNEISSANGFSIYPNPVADNLTIAFSDLNNKETLVTILDFTGKEVYDKMEMIAGGKINLAIDNLAPGIYLLRVNGETRKFVKE